jgi:hypothetical protein
MIDINKVAEDVSEMNALDVNWKLSKKYMIALAQEFLKQREALKEATRLIREYKIIAEGEGYCCPEQDKWLDKYGKENGDKI